MREDAPPSVSIWVKKAMKSRHQVSPAAIALIKRFEGLRLAAAQLDDGRWTIGYGHTRSAREGAQVTEADAAVLLTYDLVDVQAAINDLAFTPLTQNQFDALASFVFNIGLEGFRHSAVLRRINEGALLQAACAMEIWRKADFEGERIVIDALVRRRATEKALFLTPEDGFMAAPSPVLQPRMDYDAGAASSSERAAAAVAARLQTLLPDGGAASEPEPFPFDLTPIEPVRPDVAEAAEAARASVRSIFEQTRDEPEPTSVMPLAVLGVIGLALFAGGLYWAFVSRPSAGLMGSPIIGFALGFLGIVCVGSAVYFLLERLGGGED